MKNKDNGTLIHLWIRVLWLGTLAPTGVDWFHVGGTMQDLRAPDDVSLVTRLVEYLVLRGVKASGFNVSGGW
jgi:hypothetical protein